MRIVKRRNNNVKNFEWKGASMVGAGEGGE